MASSIPHAENVAGGSGSTGDWHAGQPEGQQRTEAGQGRPGLDRRVSEGNHLENAHERTRQQASASPTMGHAQLPDGEGDEQHLSGHLENMRVSGSTPQPRPQPPPLNSYPSYEGVNDPYYATMQHPTAFPQEAAYRNSSPYIPYQPMGYYDSDYSAGVVSPGLGMSVETMHGMPGYPGRPPVPRSNRTSPMNPSPPYSQHGGMPHYQGQQHQHQQHQQHHQHQQQHQQSSQRTTPPGGQSPYGMYYNHQPPPMSPNMADRRQYGSFNGMGSGGPGNMGRGGGNGSGMAGGGGGGGRGRRTRHNSVADDWNAGGGGQQGGGAGGGRYSAAPSSWASPAGASPYFYTPYQASNPHGQQIIVSDSRAPSDVWPGMPSSPQQSYRGWPAQSPRAANPQRMSFSGPSKPFAELSEKDRERKAYHPQAPARRSDWVMWVGNVPTNTSHEELWKFFNNTAPPGNDPWRGPSSIFLISRSSCAFVNLSSQADLDRAVAFFNGKSLRPQDPRCPRMVCRVRRKDDDLRAGVGAQRGTGMHREWVKAQAAGLDRIVDMPSPTAGHGAGISGLAISVATHDDTSLTSPSVASSVPPSPAILEHPPEGEGRRRDSVVGALQDGLGTGLADPTKHKSTHSYASTNSSFLTKFFPKRVFILKSATTGELEQSVKTGTWRTQRHNEPVLDQAFRTSQDVFLIFGANKSGEFFGYARMVEPIDKARAASIASTRRTQMSGSSGSGSGGSVPGPAGGSALVPPHDHRPKAQSQPGRIKAEDEERARATSDPARPAFLLTQSQQRLATSSPNQLTPSEELDRADLSPVSEPDEMDPAGHAGHKVEERHTEPAPLRGDVSGDDKSFVSMPANHHQQRHHGLDRDALRAIRGEYQHQPAMPIRQVMAEEAQKQQALGSSERDAYVTSDGVKRKDTALVGEEKKEKVKQLLQEGELQGTAVVADGAPPPNAADAMEDGEALGSEFRIEWVRVGSLPFGRTRNLRNPWNADREVKVSRDGTEVEPAVGTMLMAEWDKPDFPPQSNPSMPPTPQMGHQSQQRYHQQYYQPNY